MLELGHSLQGTLATLVRLGDQAEAALILRWLLGSESTENLRPAPSPSLRLAMEGVLAMLELRPLWNCPSPRVGLSGRSSPAPPGGVSGEGGGVARDTARRSFAPSVRGRREPGLAATSSEPADLCHLRRRARTRQLLGCSSEADLATLLCSVSSASSAPKILTVTWARSVLRTVTAMSSS